MVQEILPDVLDDSAYPTIACGHVSKVGGVTSEIKVDYRSRQ